MRRFEQQFAIHPVGQGLFYTCILKAIINHIEEDFKFVFDCGSLTHKNGNEEVDEFRNDHLHDANSRLGLFVISHFDADHVNKIGRLLQNGSKIDKLVMPFTLLEERLFLALRYINTKGSGFDDNDLYTLSVIIDPIGTLGGNFDNGTTVFLVTSGPDTPFGGEGGKAIDGENFNGNSPDLELEFDFDDPKDDLTEEDRKTFMISTSSSARIKKVKDIVKGHVHYKTQTWVRLMEFLFYRRSVGNDEKVFYEVVFKLFCQKFKIKKDANPDVVLKEIVEAVKKIRGGDVIKKLFKEARLQVPSVKITGRDLLNMNTTALSMLHVNLRSILNIFCKHHHDYWHHCDCNCYDIQKFDGTNNTKVLDYVFEGYYPFYRRHTSFLGLRDANTKFVYPNCLFTSDSYLLKEIEVNAFYNRYRNFWETFWLFQIPHHGSKYNSNLSLYARLNSRVFKFINYGTRHQFEKKYLHPDKEVISDLTATGHSINIFPINEFRGLLFNIHCQTP